MRTLFTPNKDGINDSLNFHNLHLTAVLARLPPANALHTLNMEHYEFVIGAAQRQLVADWIEHAQVRYTPYRQQYNLIGFMFDLHDIWSWDCGITLREWGVMPLLEEVHAKWRVLDERFPVQYAR